MVTGDYQRFKIHPHFIKCIHKMIAVAKKPYEGCWSLAEGVREKTKIKTEKR